MGAGSTTAGWYWEVIGSFAFNLARRSAALAVAVGAESSACVVASGLTEMSAVGRSAVLGRAAAGSYGVAVGVSAWVWTGAGISG